MDEATPRPWVFRQYHDLPDFSVDGMSPEQLAEIKAKFKPIPSRNNDGGVFIGAGDQTICVVRCQTKFKRGTGHDCECAERDANAGLIVRAVNAFDDLRAVAGMVAISMQCQYQQLNGLCKHPDECMACRAKKALSLAKDGAA